VTHRGETCREEEEDATDLNGDKDMVNGAIDVEYSRDTWEPGIFFVSRDTGIKSSLAWSC